MIIEILFLLTPLREGRRGYMAEGLGQGFISTHAPAGGATLDPDCAVVTRHNFYSRPCGRGDLLFSLRRSRTGNFYSRPCGRGDKEIYAGPCYRAIISTHAPAGGATGSKKPDDPTVNISTHAPAGGATSLTRSCSTSPRISTHAPAGGATQGRLARKCAAFISTHAPAGGATPVLSVYLVTDFRFLLTPLREGRLLVLFCPSWLCKYFYSRPCGRGDISHTNRKEAITLISTHAPAGGATSRCSCYAREEFYFYSRPCGRGDFRVGLAPLGNINFYSRPCGRGDEYPPLESQKRKDFYSRPCGRGDLLLPAPSGREDHFYSRPCGRGDAVGEIVVADRLKFLLTPLREGRRLLPRVLAAQCDISTHAPAGGATCRAVFREPCFDDFYSRPCGRGDPAAPSRTVDTEGFLLTPLREGRLAQIIQIGAGREISTHAPAGGATHSPYP